MRLIGQAITEIPLLAVGVDRYYHAGYVLRLHQRLDDGVHLALQIVGQYGRAGSGHGQGQKRGSQA